MKSEEKLEVIKQKMPQFGGKTWVLVKHKNGFAFIPSFEDLFRIVRAICECEDDKYPNGQGRNMVQDFLWDACDPDISFEFLVLKYKIRVGAKMVDYNGLEAHVKEAAKLLLSILEDLK